MSYSISFSFSWDNTLNFTSTDIVQNSIKITDQRFNNLKSSSSSVSLQIRPDTGLKYQRLLRSNEGDIQAVLYKDNSVIFTGYLSRSLSWSVGITGSEPLDILLEDTGLRKFKKKLAQEDGVGVYDTPYNIISNICSFCGVTFDDSDINQTDYPELYVNVAKKIDREETCEAILEDMLYELGYVYYWTVTGTLKLQKIDLEQEPSSISESDLYEVNGNSLALSSKAREYTVSTVKYSELRNRTGVNIYQVDTSSTRITLDNMSNLWWDGEYHDSVEDPVPGTVEMEDIDAGNEIIWFSHSSLVPTITVYASGSGSQLPSTVLRHRQTPDSSYPYRDTDRLDILIDNTESLNPLVAYSAFQAKGNVVTIDENTTMSVSDGAFTGSDYEYEYETSWIHDSVRARALAERTAKYNLYANSTYNFYTKEDLPLGSTVTVTDTTFAHASITLFITGRTYTRFWFQDEPCYKYTGQAISSLISQFIPVESSVTVRPQYSAPQYTYVRYSAYADGHDMTETPTSASRYMGTYTGTSASCPPYTDFTWIGYAVDDLRIFNLIVEETALIQNRRRTDSQDIHVKVEMAGYIGTPEISYYFSDEGTESTQTMTGTDLTITVPYDNNHTSVVISATLTGADAQTVTLMAIDNTQEYVYYGELNIDTSDYYDADGNLDPSQYDQIDWTSIDSRLGENEKFIEGDSFFNNWSETGFTDVYIYVRQNDRWIPVNTSTFSNSVRSKICMQAQKDVLSTIEVGSVSKSDFGYFNTIIAGTVTADYIGGQEIEVHDGGFLYAGDVDLNQPAGQRVGDSGAGFCFDSNGNAEMSNIRITGDSTIEGGSTVLGTLINYDTANPPMPVFKTVKETDTQVTMAGSKADGTDNPNAYIWNEFRSYLLAEMMSKMASGTTYSGSGTLYGNWSGSSISNRSIRAGRYFASAPSSTGVETTYNCQSGFDHDETRTVYTNSNPYRVIFSSVFMYAKTVQEPTGLIGPLGWGFLRVRVYNSGGSLLSTLCDFGAGTGRGGGQTRTASNVEVPPGGYIVAEWGEGDTWWIQSETNDGYIRFTYKESDNFTQGVNLVISNGQVYNASNVIPDSASFSTYPQSISFSGTTVSVNMTMTASSSWPVEKFYRFTYSTPPGVSSVVTTSIFSAQSFSYRGAPKTIVSITYSNSYLKAIDANGQTYEFYTAAGYYYPRYSLSFTTLGESLGAYMRSVLPTDDPNTHNIGAAGTYASGVPQRWDSGFFRTIDVLDGIVTPSVNAGWHVNIISVDTTLPNEFVVSTMRPYYIMSSGATGPALTMPGGSTSSYTIFIAGASGVARAVVAGGGTFSTSNYVSATQPWCVLFILRTA